MPIFLQDPICLVWLQEGEWKATSCHGNNDQHLVHWVSPNFHSPTLQSCRGIILATNPSNKQNTLSKCSLGHVDTFSEYQQMPPLMNLGSFCFFLPPCPLCLVYWVLFVLCWLILIWIRCSGVLNTKFLTSDAIKTSWSASCKSRMWALGDFSWWAWYIIPSIYNAICISPMNAHAPNRHIRHPVYICCQTLLFEFPVL